MLLNKIDKMRANTACWQLQLCIALAETLNMFVKVHVIGTHMGVAYQNSWLGL